MTKPSQIVFFQLMLFDRYHIGPPKISVLSSPSAISVLPWTKEGSADANDWVQAIEMRCLWGPGGWAQLRMTLTVFGREEKSYSVKELWPHKQARVMQEWGHEPRNGETGKIARKQKEHKSTETLTLAHGLTLDFWPPELQENKSLLSQVT